MICRLFKLISFWRLKIIAISILLCGLNIKAIIGNFKDLKPNEITKKVQEYPQASIKPYHRFSFLYFKINSHLGQLTLKLFFTQALFFSTVRKFSACEEWAKLIDDIYKGEFAPSLTTARLL